MSDEDETAVEDELAEIIKQSLPEVPDEKPEVISEVPASPIKGKISRGCHFVIFGNFREKEATRGASCTGSLSFIRFFKKDIKLLYIKRFSHLSLTLRPLQVLIQLTEVYWCQFLTSLCLNHTPRYPHHRRC